MDLENFKGSSPKIESGGGGPGGGGGGKRDLWMESMLGERIGDIENPYFESFLTKDFGFRRGRYL